MVETYIGLEALYWTDGAGTDHLLGQNSDQKQWYTEWSGFDLPPIDYQGQPIPQYHGEMYRGHRYQPRVINVGILLRPGTSLYQLWDGRKTLLDWLNPESGIGKLKLVRPTQASTATRVIEGYVLGPLGMDSTARRSAGKNGQFAILQVWCPYPLWYDSTLKSGNANLNGATPVTLALTNSGQIETFPDIKIEPAANTPQIQVAATPAHYLLVEHNIASGYVTVYGGRGNKRALTDSGDEVRISAESQFFSLPKGASTLTLSCTSGTGKVTVSWYEYYLGV